MNYIVWQRPDGGLVITIPADPSADPEAVAVHALNADPSLVDCVRLPDVDANSLPSRRFRSCWRFSEKSVAVDADLARQQVLAEVRAERNAALKASDTDLIVLQEDIDLEDERDRQELAKLKARRQALRDLPAVVAAELKALTTPAELEAYRAKWPTKE